MRNFTVMAVTGGLLALSAAIAAIMALSPQDIAMLTLTQATLVVFTLTNTLRVFAYFPQIWKAATADLHGVRGISCLTWTLFLLANLGSVAYALVNLQDWTMAAIFLANAVGCSAVVGLATWRRIVR